MLVRFTYLLVILIWATTPLAIKLGGDTLAPIAGLTLRIALAFTVGSLICTVGIWHWCILPRRVFPRV